MVGPLRSRFVARLAVATLFASFALIPGGSGQAASDAVPARFAAPKVFIFYYDWYGAPPYSPNYIHWDGGNRGRPAPSQNITSESYPVLGAYDSSAASVIRQHMAWIKAAHIDVVTLDWWGQGSREDRLAKLVMDGAAAHGLKVNFIIDAYAGETPASIGSDIAYIYRKYGGHPAFYRVARPTKYGPSKRARGVFMLYSPPALGSNSSAYARLMDGIRGTANDAIVLVRSNDSLLYSDANVRQSLSSLHFDGMFNYGAYSTSAYQRQLPQSNDYILLFSVAPGFDNSRAAGSHTLIIVRRNNGSFYDGGWSTLISKRPEWISIVSFNEWHETTQIEPARPFTYGTFSYLDYQGAYGLHGPAASNAYLTRTTFWADRFKGTRPVARPTASPPRPAASPSPVTSPTKRPTSTPPALPISIPALTRAAPELALILIIVGGLIGGAVLLWRRRR
jgi:glycosyl hydrolase family 99